MNEHHDSSATRLLREASDGEHGDVDLLVRGGLARGHRLRRRRRLQTTLASVAAVGVVGLGASVAPGLVGSDADDPVGTPAASGTASGSDTASPTPEPTETPTGSPAPSGLVVPIAQADLAPAFASLFPGEVTNPPQKEDIPGNPVADFTWNGFGVRVGITASDYVTGEPIDDPLERCRKVGGGPAPCVDFHMGYVAQSLRSTGPEVDGGVTSHFVTVYRTDGWDVTIVSHNAPDSDGPVPPGHPEPPFAFARLLSAASSDVWFTPAR